MYDIYAEQNTVLFMRRYTLKRATSNTPGPAEKPQDGSSTEVTNSCDDIERAIPSQTNHDNEAALDKRSTAGIQDR